MTRHTFEIREETARLIHDMAKDRMITLHNWIASAVERGDKDEAQKLVKSLRQIQIIYGTFNMQTKLEIYPNKTTHTEHVLI